MIARKSIRKSDTCCMLMKRRMNGFYISMQKTTEAFVRRRLGRLLSLFFTIFFFSCCCFVLFCFVCGPFSVFLCSRFLTWLIKSWYYFWRPFLDLSRKKQQRFVLKISFSVAMRGWFCKILRNNEDAKQYSCSLFGWAKFCGVLFWTFCQNCSLTLHFFWGGGRGELVIHGGLVNRK